MQPEVPKALVLDGVVILFLTALAGPWPLADGVAPFSPLTSGSFWHHAGMLASLASSRSPWRYLDCLANLVSYLALVLAGAVAAKLELEGTCVRAFPAGAEALDVDFLLALEANQLVREEVLECHLVCFLVHVGRDLARSHLLTAGS